MSSQAAAESLTPSQWGETLSAPPLTDVRIAAPTPVLIRRWRGISPIIEQPSLDQHYLSLHLGGAKRLRRRGEGREIAAETVSGAFSFIPAGAAFDWRTEGPVDFAHIYFEPKFVDHVLSAMFDRDPRGVSLHDPVGARDPLVEALAQNLLLEVGSPDDFDQGYLRELAQLLVARLLRTHSTLRTTDARARYALAPHRLRRALDFIEANLGESIGAEDVAAVTGVSPFHFSRSFRQATGVSPYAFLIQRRIACAQKMLTETALPLAEIAGHCGFGSHSQLSRMFKQTLGVSPSRYRARH